MDCKNDNKSLSKPIIKNNTKKINIKRPVLYNKNKPGTIIVFSL